ncbi:hypothetical protein [Pseudobacteriovorax antillogorgiicola]|uniref:Lipoprotein n=1 Tax=Pseudobacteriovorax antillogorgiicola TaxID=1513793 RepID=A0A1Y6BL55_9BACT|nr:hypothetical protein [Pseudobacteriovorax antillogorgiicola]TCS55363.1 hypothetical protein EDD56_10584 [Pseudobacteriovorax antillogorgiicola]SMF13524.1 hypothetical protein SAMN06296036_105240 [Pseudobacteriovorax antillogorgiicola]
MLNKGLPVLLAISLGACVTPNLEPQMPEGYEKPVSKTPQKQPGAELEAEPMAQQVPAVDCHPLTGPLADLPAFVAEKSVMIGEFLKTCNMPDGTPGYVKGSPWTAMGFPCSGGRGVVDWKGSAYMPKLIIFNFKNSCPMRYTDQRQLEEDLKQLIEFPEESRLIAYYPFSVVYWEVVGFRDADVGFRMELFSGPARKEVWPRFQAYKPIPVKLFGRENALVKTEHFYEVDGSITKDGEEDFIFKVERVKVLSEEEVENVKRRCEGLKPRRNCQQLFRT